MRITAVKHHQLKTIFTGSHFHESGLDDAGYFWGTYAARKGHCLFRYHPDIGQPELYDVPIPNLDSGHIFTFPMNGPIQLSLGGNLRLTGLHSG